MGSRQAHRAQPGRGLAGPVSARIPVRRLDVEVPSLRDYVIVAYRRGTTPMHRRVGGDWVDEQVGPGDVSLLTRAAESHWAWPRRIEVVHVYLTQAELARTCQEMYGREVAEVELLDEVKADDPDIHRIATLLAREAARGGIGSRLLVESLACQLGVYNLRKHVHVLFRELDGTAGLSSAQERAVRDYVHEHLQDNLSVGDLADSWIRAASSSPGGSSSRRRDAGCLVRDEPSPRPRRCCGGRESRWLRWPISAASPTRVI